MAEMKLGFVGEGKVLLISKPNRILTDIAARFVRSERDLEDIIASPYDKEIVKNILSSGHEAATEFDYWVFGIEGFSRVCETQLVRKRLASYIIKSGRAELKGKRKFSVVAPKEIYDLTASIKIESLNNLSDYFLELSGMDILAIIQQWYEQNREKGYKEEDLRYLKPQATEFKAIIGMSTRGLRDFFAIRTCRNAQAEIRDLAVKMLKICRKEAPDLFSDAGPNCVRLGYCPENKYQNPKCNMIRKDQFLENMAKCLHLGEPAPKQDWED